jgi:nitrogen fixation-related uncharacterized protein
VAVAIALFAAGIAMGIAGACMWAWGVHNGQFRDLEETKRQLFWPDLAPAGEGLGQKGEEPRKDDGGEDQ